MDQQPEQSQQPELGFWQKIKRNKRKWLAWGLCICLLVLIIAMAVHLLRPAPAPAPVPVGLPQDCSQVYYRKGSALYRAYPGDKPQRVASNLGYAEPLLAESPDGKSLYYLDDLNLMGSGDLYCRSLEDLRKKPERMDTDVSAFSLSGDGTLLVYSKEDALYYHDLQERRLISAGVRYHFLSEDHRRALYLDEDQTLWRWEYGSEPEQVDTGVTSVTHYHGSMDWSYYRREDLLYRLDWAEAPTRVSANVCSVLRTYPDGSLYYSKETLQQLNTLDMVLEDGQNLRMWNLLAGEKMSFYTYSLFYFNGEESVPVGEDLTAPAVAPEGQLPVAVYRTCKPESVEKVSLSQVTYVSQVQPLILQALHQASQSYVAVGERVTVVDAYEMESPVTSQDGKWLYYLDRQEQLHGKLYRLSLERPDTAPAELVDQQVHSRFALADGETAVYFRDAQTTGLLYRDGKLLAQRVPVENGAVICPVTGAVAYICDWNEATASGKLACYRDGKIQILASNVHKMAFLPNGHLVFLSGYDPELQLGKLCYFDGKLVTDVDEQVSELVLLP